MIETRIASVVALLRVLEGAEPITRQHVPLTRALERLREATSPGEIKRLDRLIWGFWSSAGTREAVAALNRAHACLATENFRSALGALDDAIAADFAFAEAWNRRATVYFLLGEHDRAMADIERVLIFEPRHYGALSGLGQLLAKEARPDAALLAFEAALRINPHLTCIRRAVQRLRESENSPTSRRPIVH
jgi:tetratricopeptide (TPR) repeat protein